MWHLQWGLNEVFLWKNFSHRGLCSPQRLCFCACNFIARNEYVCMSDKIQLNGSRPTRQGKSITFGSFFIVCLRKIKITYLCSKYNAVFSIYFIFIWNKIIVFGFNMENLPYPSVIHKNEKLVSLKIIHIILYITDTYF